MKDQEVLEKAIEIAVKNGMKASEIRINKSLIPDETYVVTLGNNLHYLRYAGLKHCYSLLFSHEFAKSFWGEKVMCYDNFKFNDELDHYDHEPMGNYEYQYHLMMMVRKENPIDYLRKFVDTAEKANKI